MEKTIEDNKNYRINLPEQFKFKFPTDLNQSFLKPRILMLIALLGFGILSYSSTQHTIHSTVETNEWIMVEVISEGDAKWKIYSKEVKGSKFLAFKIEGELKMSPLLAVKAMREEIENSKAYLDEKEGFTEVLSRSEKELLSYSVFHMPFPFKDRAMLEKYTFSVDQNTGIHRVTWKEDWNAATSKEAKGVIRIPLNQGSWEFIPMKGDKSKAIYTVINDPGGKIPAKFVNSGIIKELPKKFRSLEKVAAIMK